MGDEQVKALGSGTEVTLLFSFNIHIKFSFCNLYRALCIQQIKCGCCKESHEGKNYLILIFYISQQSTFKLQDHSKTVSKRRKLGTRPAGFT